MKLLLLPYFLIVLSLLRPGVGQGPNYTVIYTGLTSNNIANNDFSQWTIRDPIDGTENNFIQCTTNKILIYGGLNFGRRPVEEGS